MSVGMASTKLMVLVGAGVTGSVILNNPYLSDVFKNVVKVLARHIEEGGKEGDEDSGSQTDSTSAALAAQVRRLTQELKQLASQSRSITVVNSGQRSSGSGVVSLVIPVALLGAAGYGYMWWKGLRWSDLMYVTRQGMQQAVDNFTKQMAGLSSALAAARKQLAGRIDDVSKTLDDSVQVQDLIKKDVSEVRVVVRGVNSDLKALQSTVDGMDNKISNIEHKTDIATRGILLLCRFVTQNMEGRPELREDFVQLSSIAATASGGGMTRSISFTKDKSAGLKDIHLFSAELTTVVPGTAATAAAAAAAGASWSQQQGRSRQLTCSASMGSSSGGSSAFHMTELGQQRQQQQQQQQQQHQHARLQIVEEVEDRQPVGSGGPSNPWFDSRGNERLPESSGRRSYEGRREEVLHRRSVAAVDCASSSQAREGGGSDGEGYAGRERRSDATLGGRGSELYSSAFVDDGGDGGDVACTRRGSAAPATRAMQLLPPEHQQEHQQQQQQRQQQRQEPPQHSARPQVLPTGGVVSGQYSSVRNMPAVNFQFGSDGI